MVLPINNGQPAAVAARRFLGNYVQAVLGLKPGTSTSCWWMRFQTFRRQHSKHSIGSGRKLRANNQSSIRLQSRLETLREYSLPPNELKFPSSSSWRFLTQNINMAEFKTAENTIPTRHTHYRPSLYVITIMAWLIDFIALIVLKQQLSLMSLRQTRTGDEPGFSVHSAMCVCGIGP